MANYDKSPLIIANVYVMIAAIYHVSVMASLLFIYVINI